MSVGVRSITSTPTQAMRTADLSDKLDGFPKRGVNTGGGIHAEVPATWDLTPPVPFGWASYRDAVSGSEFQSANGDTWLRVNGAAPTLTPAERTELITLLTPARAFDGNFGLEFW